MRAAYAASFVARSVCITVYLPLRCAQYASQCTCPYVALRCITVYLPLHCAQYASQCTCPYVALRCITVLAPTLGSVCISVLAPTLRSVCISVLVAYLALSMHYSVLATYLARSALSGQGGAPSSCMLRVAYYPKDRDTRTSVWHVPSACAWCGLPCGLACGILCLHGARDVCAKENK